MRKIVFILSINVIFLVLINNQFINFVIGGPTHIFSDKIFEKEKESGRKKTGGGMPSLLIIKN
jgi:hypothetical protein